MEKTERSIVIVIVAVIDVAILIMTIGAAATTTFHVVATGVLYKAHASS